jgi:hypothetical protein
MLPEVIAHAKVWMSEQREAFEKVINPKLNENLKALEALQHKQYAEVERRYAETKLAAATAEERQAVELRRIDKVFEEFMTWVEDTMTTEDNPYIQVIAVLGGVR